MQINRITTLTTKLQIASVTESPAVDGEDDAARSGGSNVLTATQLDGLAQDPDDLQRQLQALAAASGGLPGSALITVDPFSTTGTPANKQREGFEFSGPLMSRKGADFALWTSITAASMRML